MLPASQSRLSLPSRVSPPQPFWMASVRAGQVWRDREMRRSRFEEISDGVGVLKEGWKSTGPVWFASDMMDARQVLLPACAICFVV